jgi:hypothetical protein
MGCYLNRRVRRPSSRSMPGDCRRRGERRRGGGWGGGRSNPSSRFGGGSDDGGAGGGGGAPSAHGFRPDAPDAHNALPRACANAGDASSGRGRPALDDIVARVVARGGGRGVDVSCMCGPNTRTFNVVPRTRWRGSRGGRRWCQGRASCWADWWSWDPPTTMVPRPGT